MPTLITTDQHLTTQCDRKILKGTVKALKKKRFYHVQSMGDYTIKDI